MDEQAPTHNLAVVGFEICGRGEQGGKLESDSWQSATSGDLCRQTHALSHRFLQSNIFSSPPSAVQRKSRTARVDSTTLSLLVLLPSYSPVQLWYAITMESDVL